MKGKKMNIFEDLDESIKKKFKDIDMKKKDGGEIEI